MENDFANLNSRLRTAAARTVPHLRAAIREALTRFKPDECRNYLAAAGDAVYDPALTVLALAVSSSPFVCGHVGVRLSFWKPAHRDESLAPIVTIPPGQPRDRRSGMLLTAYPDEVFYSVLARTSDAFGLGPKFGANQLIYGHHDVLALIDLPARVDLLIPRLLPGSTYTASRIIRDHSLFNYHSSFCDEERRSKAFNAIQRGDTKQATHSLCLANLRVDLSLRFCAECVRDDIKADRVPYWRRSHQLPGVVCCHVHLCLLSKTTARKKISKGLYLSVDVVIEQHEHNACLPSDHCDELQIAVAKGSARLLNYTPSSRSLSLVSQLRSVLLEGGWFAGSLLRKSALLHRVEERFGSQFFDRLRVRRGHNPWSHVDVDWIDKTVTRFGSTVNPLPYLVVMAAIDVDVETLVSQRSFAPPQRSTASSETPCFGGPCLNPLCSEYLPDHRRDEPQDLPQGRRIVSCAVCGFTYKKDFISGHKSSLRIISCGSIWEDALRSECASGTMHTAAISERFGMNIVIAHGGGMGLKPRRRSARLAA